MSRAQKQKLPIRDDAPVSIGEALGMSAPHDRMPAESPKPDTKSPGTPSRAIVRRMTGGRGGRVVTSISFRPQLTAEAADTLARSMRKSLGCGSRVEQNGDGIAVILQGDIRDRAKEWLLKNGAAKSVTEG